MFDVNEPDTSGFKILYIPASNGVLISIPERKDAWLFKTTGNPYNEYVYIHRFYKESYYVVYGSPTNCLDTDIRSGETYFYRLMTRSVNVRTLSNGVTETNYTYSSTAPLGVKIP